jgi:single-stranded-DNA-specific exonuclease
MLSNISKGYISADDIAFQIAPRLNSSGRIDNAMVSFNFLISQNYDQTAKYFFQIEDFNEQRKEIERNLSNQVIKNVDNSKKIILYYDTNLHEGIIGIVASRIVEKFQKPTIIFSLQNEILKGSGRSIGNIDIFKLIESTQHLLLKWGGHKMAGGLSLKLENFEEFQKIILNEIEKYKKDDFNEISKSNLGELDFNDINFTLIEILEKYEPYGEGNPRPTFQAFDVLVIDVKIIGKNKEYLKITVKQEFSSNYIDILVFKTNTNIKIKDKISFEYSIDKTIFRGKVSIQGLFKRFIS